MSAYTTAPSPTTVRLPRLPSQKTSFEATMLLSVCQYLDLPGRNVDVELDCILVLQMPVGISDVIPFNVKFSQNPEEAVSHSQTT